MNNEPTTKPIKGFEDEYEITEDGRVLSKLTDMYLKPSINKHGYLIVSLMKDGKRKIKQVHILVAEAYIPNDDPENKTYVNHLDGNTINPHASNLEWATPSRNTQHAYDTGLIHRKATAVIRINLDTGAEVKFSSITEASQATENASNSGIVQVCKQLRATHAGYGWRYQN